ncbi:FAD-dependent oxidoreductase [Agriterribacter sp.]|uniref:FAD-dependent oxidoreductase n=1 Tax=Agriterribacter sp. TaxID=2821509 RepID=UPI002C453C60|nr:FAD-dependent oxidoreductase [Agriterribacter sp.]HRP58455.1 FAD-dependent oxidoreductase [Agriterribacter sp.]
MKKNKQHYEHLVIGFGKGGKTLAAYLAKHGKQVALIERSEKMYGGGCINIACIPTKSFIVSAENNLPYEKAYKVKNELTSFLRKKNFDNIDKLGMATVITGEAAFVSTHEVKVTLHPGNEELLVSADRIFINTGSEPFVLPIAGITASKKVFTSASLMEQPALLKKLVIIGGGFIGLEFADMYAKFGAEVTLLDHGKTFLPREDKDIADEIFKVPTAKKINIITGASVQRITDAANNTVIVQYKNSDGHTIEAEASAVLVATGRKPVTESLNLPAAGIQTDQRGYIKVDASLRTNIPHIWAVGDINGGPQFTYISLDDFRIIRDQLFGGDYTSVSQRKPYPFSVFITPQLAHIGLREKEAVEKGYTVKVAKLPASAVPRARILNDTNGLLKTVVDSNSNKILGCTLFCADANEMINTVQMAMHAGLHYRELRDKIYTHPSMTEAFNDLYALI